MTSVALQEAAQTAPVVPSTAETRHEPLPAKNTTIEAVLGIDPTGTGVGVGGITVAVAGGCRADTAIVTVTVEVITVG